MRLKHEKASTTRLLLLDGTLKLKGHSRFQVHEKGLKSVGVGGRPNGEPEKLHIHLRSRVWFCIRFNLMKGKALKSAQKIK